MAVLETLTTPSGTLTLAARKARRLQCMVAGAVVLLLVLKVFKGGRR